MSEYGPNNIVSVSIRPNLDYSAFMDFEHVFDQLEITANPFALCEIEGKCSLNMGRDANASLHYILTGEGELTIQDFPPVSVTAGSLVLIPALQNHELRSFGIIDDSHFTCDPPELKLKHLLKIESDSYSNGRITALCAHLQVGLRGAVDVIDLLRSPIAEHIDERNALHSTVGLMLKELSQPSLGSRAMIKVLLTQCVIELLRIRLIEDGSEMRWMAALRDPMMWTALRAMLDEPGDPHTVDTLAERVGMSRSAFAARFASAYGSGPIELLRDLRLRRAAELLRDTSLPVKRIAQMVGFNSRTAFSRLFEKQMRKSPTEYRQTTIEG